MVCLLFPQTQSLCDSAAFSLLCVSSDFTVRPCVWLQPGLFSVCYTPLCSLGNSNNFHEVWNFASRLSANIKSPFSPSQHGRICSTAKYDVPNFSYKYWAALEQGLWLCWATMGIQYWHSFLKQCPTCSGQFYTAFASGIRRKSPTCRQPGVSGQMVDVISSRLFLHWRSRGTVYSLVLDSKD